MLLWNPLAYLLANINNIIKTNIVTVGIYVRDQDDIP